MSEVRARLVTQYHEKDMTMPGVGTTRFGMEAVTGLQLPGSTPLHFSHYHFPGEGRPGEATLTLPEPMAVRLAHFSQKHFVEGRPGFDCRAFVHFMMGWEDEVKTGVVKAYSGTYVHPEETKPAHPYVIATKDGPTPHAMLGADAPTHSFGVIGLEYPLVVAKNTDLMKAFGGFALLEVTQAANVPHTA